MKCGLMRKIVTIRSVPHTEDLPVPVPPQQYILDSEPTENLEKTPQPSTSMDADFTADIQFKESIELHKRN
jgi:hypothetical protein